MTKPGCSTDNLTVNSGDPPPGSLRVLQLSDPHLFADPGGELLGMRTLNSLQHVIAHARRHLPAIDLTLVTGDLVHDASPAGYDLLKKQLGELNALAYCLPGNHDDAKTLSASISGNPVDTPFSVQKNGWSIILLDSCLPGKTAGCLSDGQLDKLQQCLAAYPEHHTLICLHHHTVAVQSRWLDRIMLNNADALFAITDRYPQIKGITCGHVHQSFETRRKGVLLMGSPSTCFQFAPGSTNFAIDSKPPGYRQLTLLPDGAITTTIFYLNNFAYSIDRSSSGY